MSRYLLFLLTTIGDVNRKSDKTITKTDVLSDFVFVFVDCKERPKHLISRYLELLSTVLWPSLNIYGHAGLQVENTKSIGTGTYKLSIINIKQMASLFDDLPPCN
jgi:hypothetical protein